MLDSREDSGRPGEPWIWTDLRTGTQLPLSYRSWPGTYRPDELGLSPWDVLLKFGHHLPGGGLGEPADAADSNNPDTKETAESGAASGAGEAPSAPKAESDGKSGRWKLSGPLEIDCLICHSNDRSYNYKLRARQISQQNLAWAATVAA
ncbi:MAG: hypothetical protein GXP27_07655, partial [Planctomycetes bacterium]|nr:hypothetical protein [Planctomycetota bacterium]